MVQGRGAEVVFLENPDFVEISPENRFPAVWGRFFEARCLPDAGPTQVTRRADLSKIVSSKSNTGTGANDRQ